MFCLAPARRRRHRRCRCSRPARRSPPRRSCSREARASASPARPSRITFERLRLAQARQILRQQRRADAAQAVGAVADRAVLRVERLGCGAPQPRRRRRTASASERRSSGGRTHVTPLPRYGSTGTRSPAAVTPISSSVR